MGAIEYQDLKMIKGDANDAFSELQEEANDYNGHQGGYSGDIQGADGFRLAKDNPRYGTKAFQKWEEKHLEKMNTGDCMCVEISKGSSFYKERKNNSRFQGKKGVRFFYFFGVSSY